MRNKTMRSIQLHIRLTRRRCRDLRKRLFGRYKRQAKARGAPEPTVGQGRARSRSPEREKRVTSEQRRARIQEWSRKRKEEAGR